MEPASPTSYTYIQVILPLKLQWDPYYAVPAELCPESGAGRVSRGSRVRVTFHGKTLVGVVSATAVVPPSSILPKVLPIMGIEDLEDITEGELRLWEFISRYYMCTKGEVFKCAYPSLKVKSEEVLLRRQQRREEALSREADRIGESTARLTLRLRSLREKLSKARKDSTREEYGRKIAEVAEALEALSEQKRILSARSGDRDGSEALARWALSRLENPYTLTPEQADAMARIDSVIRGADPRPVVLSGVTGSGKTAIYITEAIRTLKEGKNVLYLVPEVALSRQLEERLRKVFGDLLLTFHSSETIVHRRDVASSIRGGRYVVLGTRSALLLPHSRLGLIVVDEEHDPSYKQQDPAPRYNARDLCAAVSRWWDIPLILGSATPSLESIQNVILGNYRMVDLPLRYFGGPGAEVEIVDTVNERKRRRMRGAFSQRLLDHMGDALSHGGQVLVLRPRKSYSTSLQCSACGYIPRCPHCNVPLSYHKARERMTCHHCGTTLEFFRTCPSCGNGVLEPIGTGTQKVEEQLLQLFPDARIGRLDGDSASSQKETISAFEAGRIDIMVGTQLITKGFDFEGVSVVAVIGADSLMGAEDFRSDERALQTLDQFRGRCSRRGQRGVFLIQTSVPDHPVYAYLRDQYTFDEDGTAVLAPEGEGGDIVSRLLDERRQFGYPPFTRIIQIRVKDASEERLTRESGRIAGLLRSVLQGGGAEVTGPFSPLVDKISDQHIRHIGITLRRDASLSSRKEVILASITRFEKEENYPGHITLDVDPQ